MKLKNIFQIVLSITTLFFLTSCLSGNNTGSTSGSTAEERFLASGNSTKGSGSPGSNLGGGAVNPSPGGGSGSGGAWSGLAQICNNANLSDVESLLCKLDDILAQAVQSGQGIQSVSQELSDWLNEFQVVRAAVCQDSSQVTLLTLGSLQVMSARGFLPLPLAAINPQLDPIVQKFLQVVLKDTLALGCQVSPSALNGVIGNTSGGSSGGGGGTISPNPPGNGGPATAVCAHASDKYHYYCQPDCNNTNSCDVASCDQAVQLCHQYGCVCN